MSCRTHRRRRLGFPPGFPLGPVLLGLLVACGRDPILDRAQEIQAARPGDAGGGRPPSPPPGGAVAPGTGLASEPTPGAPADPPPGAPADPPPGQPGPAAAGSPHALGPMSTITGTISLSDYELGQVHVDVFDGDQQKLEGKRPSVVATLRLDQPGPFTVQVPVSDTQVWIGAFVDEDLDGRPGPQDPSGWYRGNPVDTTGGAAEVDIVLERQPPPPQAGL